MLQQQQYLSKSQHPQQEQQQQDPAMQGQQQQPKGLSPGSKWSSLDGGDVDVIAGLFVHHVPNDDAVELGQTGQQEPALITQAHFKPSSGPVHMVHVPTSGPVASAASKQPSGQLSSTPVKAERSCDGLASQNSASSWGRDTINLYIQSLGSMHQWSAYGAGETTLTTPNGVSAMGTPAMMTTACSLASAGSAAWLPKEPGESRVPSTEGVVFTSLRRLSSQGLACHNQQLQQQQQWGPEALIHKDRHQHDQSLQSHLHFQEYQQAAGAEQQKGASQQRQRRVSWQDSDQLHDLPGLSVTQRTSSLEAAAAAGVSASGRELNLSEQVLVLQQQCMRLRAHRQYLLKVLQQQESQQQQLKQAHATTLSQLCQLQVSLAQRRVGACGTLS
jgi:hypothetical protein